MKDRLEKFLLDQGLKSGRFAQIMGVQPSNITHIISGRSKPGFDFIANMLTNFPELNPDWLICGHGEMYRESQENATETMPTPNVEETASGSMKSTETIESIVTQTISTQDDIASIIVFFNDGTFTKYNKR